MLRHTEPFLTAFTLGLTSGICCLISNVVMHRVLHGVRRLKYLHEVRNVVKPKGTIVLHAENSPETRFRGGLCPICLGDLVEDDDRGNQNLLEPPCGHTQHEYCLREWLASGRSAMHGASDACPVCRGPAGVRDCMQISVRLRPQSPPVQLVGRPDGERANDVEELSSDDSHDAASAPVVAATRRQWAPDSRDSDLQMMGGREHVVDCGGDVEHGSNDNVAERTDTRAVLPGAQLGQVVPGASIGSSSHFYGAVPSMPGAIDEEPEATARA